MFQSRRELEPGPDRCPPCRLRTGVWFRLRQTLAEDAPVIQPFDQDKWAATYMGVPARQALEVFTALRGWNLRLIGLALPEAQSGRSRTRSGRYDLPHHCGDDGGARFEPPGQLKKLSVPTGTT